MRKHMDVTHRFISYRRRGLWARQQSIIRTRNFTTIKLFPKCLELGRLGIAIKSSAQLELALKQFVQQASRIGAVMRCIHEDVVKVIVRILPRVFDSRFDGKLLYFRDSCARADDRT